MELMGDWMTERWGASVHVVLQLSNQAQQAQHSRSLGALLVDREHVEPFGFLLLRCPHLQRAPHIPSKAMRRANAICPVSPQPSDANIISHTRHQTSPSLSRRMKPSVSTITTTVEMYGRSTLLLPTCPPAPFAPPTQPTPPPSLMPSLKLHTHTSHPTLTAPLSRAVARSSSRT